MRHMANTLAAMIFLQLAVTVQASKPNDGCANCDVDEDSNVLLQARTAVETMGVHSQRKHSKVAPLLKMVEDMALKTPGGRDKKLIKDISDILRNELLPDLLAEKGEAQDELNTLNKNVHKCNDDVTLGEKESATYKTATDTAKTAHTECRKREKAKILDKDTKCAALATFRGNLPAAPSTSASNADHLAYLKNACSSAALLENLIDECTAATQALEAEHAQCDLDQATFEEHFCEYRKGRLDFQKSTTLCYAQNKLLFEDVKAKKMELQKEWLAEYHAMKKIECYLDTWLSDNNVQTVNKNIPKNCQAITIDKISGQDQVSLKYPPIPAAKIIDMSSVREYPGSSGFTSAYYTDDSLTYNVVVPCVGTDGTDAWTLVMKIGDDSKFGFSSPYWTNDELYNEDARGNAKYKSFTTLGFQKIRMCIDTPTGSCVDHVFSKEYGNAKELFSAGYIRDPSVDQAGILSAFAPTAGSYQNCPMQRPGFNIQCNDGNKARWGFCNNCASQPCQNSDSNDADSSIGIGLAGQSTPSEMGAGWTNYFASGAGTCRPNSMRSRKAWVYVLPQEWTLVMKIGDDSKFGFSSPYWTNDALYNEDSRGNAKYESFTTRAFQKIRMCIDTPTGSCVDHAFPKEYSNAKELFSAGYIRDPSMDQAGILSAFAPTAGSYQNCPMQRPGFNIQCNDGNKARWGFCNNCASQPCQNSDSNDADSSIGIGLAGQSTPSEMGAGWTNYFASGAGTCKPNSKRSRKAWVYVLAQALG